MWCVLWIFCCPTGPGSKLETHNILIWILILDLFFSLWPWKLCVRVWQFSVFVLQTLCTGVFTSFLPVLTTNLHTPLSTWTPSRTPVPDVSLRQPLTSTPPILVSAPCIESSWFVTLLPCQSSFQKTSTKPPEYPAPSPSHQSLLDTRRVSCLSSGLSKYSVSYKK